MSTQIFMATRHDWTEDFVRPDGSHGPFYMNKCRECKAEFYGHKYRRTCRNCVEIFKKQAGTK